MTDLLILAEGGSWERRFQVSSLAALSAASGRSVSLALFFGALDAWVTGEWQRPDPSPPLTRERIEAVGAPPLAEMIEDARAGGHLTLYACSASMRFLGLSAGEVQARVDLIAGWQTFQKLVFEAGRVVTF